MRLRLLLQYQDAITYPILVIIRVRRPLKRMPLLIQYWKLNWKSNNSLLKFIGGLVSALCGFGYFSNTRLLLLIQFRTSSAPHSRHSRARTFPILLLQFQNLNWKIKGSLVNCPCGITSPIPGLYYFSNTRMLLLIQYLS